MRVKKIKRKRKKKRGVVEMNKFYLTRRRRISTCISAFVITALVITNAVGISYAVSTTTSDISATDSVAMLLSSMGVISLDSSGSYNLGKSVTRAEFAKMLVMASPYKDLVTTTSKSSPFRDVASNNWAAPYIKIAASKGLLSGYSDGSFRPNNIVTLEQGVNSALKLLGYTQSDFTGIFPYAQMNIYSSNGLSDNIVGGIGTLMTKGDAANLIYNLMGTSTKDGTQKFAETLGYSLNASGEVDYAGVINANMNGPYTVKSSSWASNLGMSAANLTVYKNGSVVSASEVENYDIIYYSQSRSTIWVYDDRVTGIYEKASPNQNSVTSVTISGKEYQLESTAAFSALSSSGTLKIGNAVTLLLGKNGGVADAVSSTELNETVIMYITEMGSKTYENASGSKYTSKYIKGINQNSTEIEYAVSQDWMDVGNLVKISFDQNNTMNISSVSKSGSIYGKIDADLRTIGITKVATNANLIDTNMGNYIATSLDRLDGVTVNSSDILYYEASNGQVTTIIFDDITGDTMQYGVVTSAKSNNSSMSLSGSYTYIIDGVTQTLSTKDSTLNVKSGPAKFYGESGEISIIKNLDKTGSRVKSFNSAHVVIDDDNGTYPISASVSVYANSSGSYNISTLSAALDAYNLNKSISFYYDRDPSEGGQIRVIVY